MNMKTLSLVACAFALATGATVDASKAKAMAVQAAAAEAAKAAEAPTTTATTDTSAADKAAADKAAADKAVADKAAADKAVADKAAADKAAADKAVADKAAADKAAAEKPIAVASATTYKAVAGGKKVDPTSSITLSSLDKANVATVTVKTVKTGEAWGDDGKGATSGSCIRFSGDTSKLKVGTAYKFAVAPSNTKDATTPAAFNLTPPTEAACKTKYMGVLVYSK